MIMTFRFTKETFAKIVQMLEPDLLLDPRGDPLSPVQQVCVALHTYGGGHYQRVSGLCGGVSQNAARLLYSSHPQINQPKFCGRDYGPHYSGLLPLHNFDF